MGDYDHIGKAFAGLYVAAIIGSISTLILIVLAVVCGGSWIWNHVSIH